MMILIRQGNVYAPEFLGPCDLLTGGGRILALEQEIDPKALPGQVRVLDARGLNVVPGFIDGHQHFTGGGGEDGFKSRAPEMTLSMNIANGVTTAVGLLGTDALTRTVESLYAKTAALNAEGMTARMLTGAYPLPSPTLCGSVGRDIAFLDPVIGVKLAMADHRASHFDAKDLAVLAAEVKTAAMLSGKPGIITVHTGIDPQGLEMIFNIVDRYRVRPDAFIPTHINRKAAAAGVHALELARQGAFIDATCMDRPPGKTDGMVSAADYFMETRENNLSGQVCFSSDAGGSLPRWNEDQTQLLGMGVGSPAALGFELRRLVTDHGLDLSSALQPLTRTPAKAYGFSGIKGELKPGTHADILVLEPGTLAVRDVLAMGKIMMENKQIKTKGYFDKETEK